MALIRNMKVIFWKQKFIVIVSEMLATVTLEELKRSNKLTLLHTHGLILD